MLIALFLTLLALFFVVGMICQPKRGSRGVPRRRYTLSADQVTRTAERAAIWTIVRRILR